MKQRLPLRMQEGGGQEMHNKEANLGKSEKSWRGNKTGLQPGILKSLEGLVDYMSLISICPRQ